MVSAVGRDFMYSASDTNARGQFGGLFFQFLAPPFTWEIPAINRCCLRPPAYPECHKLSISIIISRLKK